jgi:hypothetical protein
LVVGDVGDELVGVGEGEVVGGEEEVEHAGDCLWTRSKCPDQRAIYGFKTIYVNRAIDSGRCLQQTNRRGGAWCAGTRLLDRVGGGSGSFPALKL